MARRERVAAVAAVLVLIVGVVVLIVRHDDDNDVATGSDPSSTTTSTPASPSTTGGLAPGTAPTSSSAPPSSAATATPVPETQPQPEPEPTQPTQPDPVPIPRGDLANARVQLTPIASLTNPIAAAARPGAPGSLYVATRAGQVHLMSADGTTVPLLDISSEVSVDGERGLLGIAVSADGGTLAVSYTDTTATHDNQLHRFSLRADGTIDLASRTRLLNVPHPTYNNHNGGGVVFGPDGALYWALGDGGGGGDPLGHGQSLESFRGKILRVDPTTGQATIAHYGLRNPWRFSFDRATNDLWIADVGQQLYEEINWLPAGAGRANFEWNLREGTHPYKGDRPADGVQPIWEYTHNPRCSITGGYVYRGANIPDLHGAYLFSDFCTGGVRALAHTGGIVELERVLTDSVDSVASFGEDAAGELYVLSFDGHVYRVDPA